MLGEASSTLPTTKSHFASRIWRQPRGLFIDTLQELETSRLLQKRKAASTVHKVGLTSPIRTSSTIVYTFIHALSCPRTLDARPREPIIGTSLEQALIYSNAHGACRCMRCGPRAEEPPPPHASRHTPSTPLHGFTWSGRWYLFFGGTQLSRDMDYGTWETGHSRLHSGSGYHPLMAALLPSPKPMPRSAVIRGREWPW